MIKPLKILIVDDEPLARGIIRRMLETDSRIQSIAEAEDGDEALETIRSNAPDIVYLDIQMPGANGFELLDQIRQLKSAAMPLIIFVTAYDEYALEAFEFYALDYLVKPVDPARFRQTFDIAVKQLSAGDEAEYQQKLFQIVSRMEPQKNYLEWVSVKTGGGISLLKIEKIRWIEAQGNYALLDFGNNLTHLMREQIGTLESKLDPQTFIRIHRSTIININFIKEIENWGRGEFKVAMSENKVFTVGHSFRANFDDFLKKKVL
ncbi:MAG TPA: LytTR family DNA-binding domain-containing protein [Pyrinomonadaceae bacterium]|jgi:two-component system LytT family response regulator